MLVGMKSVSNAQESNNVRAKMYFFPDHIFFDVSISFSRVRAQREREHKKGKMFFGWSTAKKGQHDIIKKYSNISLSPSPKE
jgi:hypothetical protein